MSDRSQNHRHANATASAAHPANRDNAQAHISADGPVYSAQDVRQGEIILRRRWQRVVFILGLAGAVLLAVFLPFWT
jgi:hypothetical protein